jgi:hypothetical protein
MPKLAALVTALVLDRPMCFTCLGEKSGATRSAIAAALRAVDGTLAIHVAEQRCQACGDIGEAVSLARPSLN